MKTWISTALLALTFVGNAWAANPSEGSATNPAPAAAFSAFPKIELRELKLEPPYAGQNANERAAAKIAEHINTQIKPIITAWNVAGASKPAGLTLTIEPSITQLKFISGKVRFWAGAFAGSSYVVMKLKLIEQPGDKIIGEPEFYQRAAAMSGAYTAGGQDNDMLQRVVTLTTKYLNDNYENATGGPTGR